MDKQGFFYTLIRISFYSSMLALSIVFARIATGLLEQFYDIPTHVSMLLLFSLSLILYITYNKR